MRGLPPPDAAGCDGCATQSSRASGAGGWLAGALVLGVVVRRRRRR
ncbi:MAG: MYXO-CTERM sorting domain-containing protein [Myxococcales bacterium]|nr:MYXO-CTERM sorting domain-containing protein [Myxococcales bacterium]